MSGVPKLDEPLLGGLPTVSLFIELRNLNVEHLVYQVTGRPDDHVLRHEKPVSPERRIEGTFEFNIFGKVTDPKEWKGYSCELTVNRLGMPFQEELTPKGYIGDGFCELDRKRVLVRLTLPPSMVRDLIDLMTKYSPGPEFNPRLRCDLVHLRESRRIELMKYGTE